MKTPKAEKNTADPRQTTVPGSEKTEAPKAEAPKAEKKPKVNQKGISVGDMSRDALLDEEHDLCEAIAAANVRKAAIHQEIADRLLLLGKGKTIKLRDGIEYRARKYEKGSMAGRRILVENTASEAAEIE